MFVFVCFILSLRLFDTNQVFVDRIACHTHTQTRARAPSLSYPISLHCHPKYDGCRHIFHRWRQVSSACRSSTCCYCGHISRHLSRVWCYLVINQASSTRYIAILLSSFDHLIRDTMQSEVLKAVISGGDVSPQTTRHDIVMEFINRIYGHRNYHSDSVIITHNWYKGPIVIDRSRALFLGGRQ